MKKLPRFVPACSLLLVTALLAACGGGSDDPAPTTVNASVTVGAATPLALNGIYATSNLSLSSVRRIPSATIPKSAASASPACSRSVATV